MFPLLYLVVLGSIAEAAPKTIDFVGEKVPVRAHCSEVKRGGSTNKHYWTPDVLDVCSKTMRQQARHGTSHDEPWSETSAADEGALAQLDVASFPGSHGAELVQNGLVRLPVSGVSGVRVVMTTSNAGDLGHLCLLLKRLPSSWRAYPIAVVHEGLLDREITRLRDCLSASQPTATAHFVHVRFRIPQSLLNSANEKAKLAVDASYVGKDFRQAGPAENDLPGFRLRISGLAPYGKRFSFGYYAMCRFFAGHGYLLPFFDKYEYVMRMDTDSRCGGSGADPIDSLAMANKTYAYNKMFEDVDFVVEGLHTFAQNYSAAHRLRPITEGPEQAADWDAASNKPAGIEFKGSVGHTACSVALRSKTRQGTVLKSGVVVRDSPIKCDPNLFRPVPSFYTNFEVAYLPFFRTQQHRSFLKAVDEHGGIYLHRWGDAPLRFLAVLMLLPPSQVIWLPGCMHS